MVASQEPAGSQQQTEVPRRKWQAEKEPTFRGNRSLPALMGTLQDQTPPEQGWEHKKNPGVHQQNPNIPAKSSEQSKTELM